MTAPVNVPGAGPLPRRTVIIAGVAAAAVVLAVVVYRKRRKASGATPTVDTTTGSTVSDGTYTNPAPVTTRDSTIDTTGGTIPTSNDQWALKALSLMPNWDASFVQIALGKFLSGQPLTSDEANAVRVAEALAGPPPVGNLTIIMQTTASSPGTDQSTTPVDNGPDTATPPLGADLYVWADNNIKAPHATAGDALNILRSLNGGMAAFDAAHIDWKPNPGPPGTPKTPVFKNPVALRIR